VTIINNNEYKKEKLKAAAYVRMSTEHQQYSTENQEAALQQYAIENDIEIIQTYRDEGKSGLRIRGRDGLKRLIHDVESKQVQFSIILVYDVSRWGRFQDPDESAVYEMRCKQAGVPIHYCAEQFANDNQSYNVLMKTMKRTMAAEYSLELSKKVFRGQSRLIGLGYRQGGSAGYGLRRQLIDQTGQAKGLLLQGQQKSIQTDRVILVPGPEEEIKIINKIYHLFVEEGYSERDIAGILNQKQISNHLNRPWTRGIVHQILINEKYIGNNVWNKGSFKLKVQRVKNAPEQWVRANSAFSPIVDEILFNAAKEIIRSRSYRLSDEEMLDALKMLFKQRGYLSGLIIDEAEGCPSSSAYQSRFGSLLKSYSLIGYTPERDYHYIEINRILRKRYPEIVEETIEKIQSLGGKVQIEKETGLLIVNSEFSVSIVLSRCRQTSTGSNRWLIRLDTGLFPDITVAVRMEPNNISPQDYYLLPSLDINNHKLNLAQENEIGLDIYRFDTLDVLFALAERTILKDIYHDIQKI